MVGSKKSYMQQYTRVPNLNLGVKQTTTANGEAEGPPFDGA